MTLTLEQSSSSLSEAIAVAGRGLVEREALVELIALAAVAGEHLLVVGPPGTAKSEAVRRVAKALGGNYFEYLLGRFTEPSEIFGPVDLRRLKDGVVETETSGMLPEAEIAFLDEVFLGSTAILNTLLGILNERTFRRGHTRMVCPLRVCVGATNALPDDDSLAAFADRFLTRIFLSSIPDPRLEELLQGGWSLGQDTSHPTASLEAIDVLAGVAKSADIEKVRPHLAHAIRILRKNGIALSDRRAVKMQRLVASAAALAGRRAPTEADVWPIVFAVPREDAQQIAREVLRDVLSRSENPSLPRAAEEASLGPKARATRIAGVAKELLAQRPKDAGAEAMQAWKLKLEGVARELDAGFSKADLPIELAAVREELVKSIADGAPSKPMNGS